MNLLLDTNALLWWLEDSPRLGRAARDAIAEPENQVYVSAASAWEIAIKVALDRLQAPPNVAQWLPETLQTNQFTALPISMAHAAGVETLPAYHADPFDRVLISQSLIENLTIVTGDEAFAQYGVRVIRT